MYDIFYSISRYSRLKKVVGKIEKDRKAPPPHCLEGRPPKNVVLLFCGGLPLIMVATRKKVMIGVQERGKFFRPHLGRLRNTLHGFAAVHVRLHTSLET